MSAPANLSYTVADCFRKALEDHDIYRIEVPRNGRDPIIFRSVEKDEKRTDIQVAHCGAIVRRIKEKIISQRAIEDSADPDFKGFATEISLDEVADKLRYLLVTDLGSLARLKQFASLAVSNSYDEALKFLDKPLEKAPIAIEYFKEVFSSAVISKKKGIKYAVITQDGINKELLYAYCETVIRGIKNKIILRLVEERPAAQSEDGKVSSIEIDSAEIINELQQLAKKGGTLHESVEAIKEYAKEVKREEYAKSRPASKSKAKHETVVLKPRPSSYTIQDPFLVDLPLKGPPSDADYRNGGINNEFEEQDDDFLGDDGLDYFKDPEELVEKDEEKIVDNIKKRQAPHSIVDNSKGVARKLSRVVGKDFGRP